MPLLRGAKRNQNDDGYWHGHTSVLYTIYTVDIVQPPGAVFHARLLDNQERAITERYVFHTNRIGKTRSITVHIMYVRSYLPQ